MILSACFTGPAFHHPYSGYLHFKTIHLPSLTLPHKQTIAADLLFPSLTYPYCSIIRALPTPPPYNLSSYQFLSVSCNHINHHSFFVAFLHKI